jgi:hypothetical protein
MTTDQPDPYTVLGIGRDATPAEISAAYRAAVRACHPDTSHPDRDRLAAVIAAYRQLREAPPASHGQSIPVRGNGQSIPVRVHPARTPDPDLRAGPVRRHPAE